MIKVDVWQKGQKFGYTVWESFAHDDEEYDVSAATFDTGHEARTAGQKVADDIENQIDDAAQSMFSYERPEGA